MVLSYTRINERYYAILIGVDNETIRNENGEEKNNHTYKLHYLNNQPSGIKEKQMNFANSLRKNYKVNFIFSTKESCIFIQENKVNELPIGSFLMD